MNVLSDDIIFETVWKELSNEDAFKIDELIEKGAKLKVTSIKLKKFLSGDVNVQLKFKILEKK